MIPHEPVRGRVPPPWVLSLDGLERTRLFAWQKLPNTPLARLLGHRLTHVVPGGATLTCPASLALTATDGQLVIAPLMASALCAACTTAAGHKITIKPLSFTMTPFRPVRVLPGSLVARARVVNASRLLAFAEVHMEDTEGRSIAHGTMQAAFATVDPPPPDPPPEIRRPEEPVYDSPDPYLRSYALPTMTLADDGRVESEAYAAPGALSAPFAQVLGLELSAASPGHMTVTIPASEWFLNTEPNVCAEILAGCGEFATRAAGQLRAPAGTRLVALDLTTRILHAVKPDGRKLRIDVDIVEMRGDLLVARTNIEDADGRLVATQDGSMLCLPNHAPQGQARRRKAERVLATLLFTDVVNSTRHTDRLGDIAWKELLDRYSLALRRELSRYNGTEVSSAGDGFLLRFDSPARAIDAARAIRAEAARHGLEVRCGIHTGECEIENNRLAGIAVNFAARIQAAARPQEILVSSTVRDLVVGGDAEFIDRGDHDLKGIAGTRRLWAVREGAGRSGG